MERGGGCGEPRADRAAKRAVPLVWLRRRVSAERQQAERGASREAKRQPRRGRGEQPPQLGARRGAIPRDELTHVAALAIVIRISPSMQTEDIAPNRLARSVQKVHDLLGRRGGSKAALIAYAGSAHLVMPPTVDVEIIDSFAGSLDPKIMPEEGDAAGEALKLAEQTLATVGGGSILWITDEVSPDEVAAVSAWRSKTRTPVRVLAPLLDEVSLKDLRSHTESGSSDLIQLTADDSDIDRLERASRFSAAAPMEGGDRWQDSGYWLTPVLLLLVLPFFRKGWMQSLAARS